MISQYPHILKFDLVTGGEPYTDENGDTVIPDGTTATIELKCRFEPNGSGDHLTTQDGKVLNYDFMIYMPLGQPDVPAGIVYKGYVNGVYSYGDTIKRFSRGQMNARAWG